ncbi:hypothetical protein [Sphingomonas sp. 1P08PE]|uniref:hypothetical protein n=1 Tax=Sphingomonas sp. 1P08PE TaxID=554122 RepID=UPI0039A17EEB
MADAQQIVVHAPGEDGLESVGVDQVDTLVIMLAIEIVGAMEDDLARPAAGAPSARPSPVQVAHSRSPRGAWIRLRLSHQFVLILTPINAS